MSLVFEAILCLIKRNHRSLFKVFQSIYTPQQKNNQKHTTKKNHICDILTCDIHNFYWKKEDAVHSYPGLESIIMVLKCGTFHQSQF